MLCKKIWTHVCLLPVLWLKQLYPKSGQHSLPEQTQININKIFFCVRSLYNAERSFLYASDLQIFFTKLNVEITICVSTHKNHLPTIFILYVPFQTFT
jgi:hypothetical protein